MKPGAKCQLVVDSCSDLPYEMVKALDVIEIHFPYIMSDGTHYDDFWQAMTQDEFFERVDEGELPTTAQVPVPVLTETFEKIAQSGIPTVYLSFTSGLSGTFDALLTVLDDIRAKYPDSEIYAVDAVGASIVEGLLDVEAAKRRDAGWTAKEIADWLEENKWFIHGYFTLESLESLKRGGRIPASIATIGDKIDVKPILTFDLEGHLVVYKMVRGRKKSLKELNKIFEEKMVPGPDEDKPTIWYSHGRALDDLHTLEEMNRQVRDHDSIDCQVDAELAVHVGSGFVAECFWGPDRRLEAKK